MEISLDSSMNNVIKTANQISSEEKTKLIIEIKKVKCELQSAYNNFDYIEDSLMIDYYTYQIKAYETKFEYLIKKAKDLGVCNI